MNNGPFLNDGFYDDGLENKETVASPEQMIEGIFGIYFLFLRDTFSIRIEAKAISDFLEKENIAASETVGIAHSIVYLFHQTFSTALSGPRHMFAPGWLYDYALHCKNSGFRIEHLETNFPANLDPIPIDPKSLLIAKKFLEELPGK